MKSYSVRVSRDGRLWYVEIPEIDGATQARNLREVERMARDYIYNATGEEEFGLDIEMVMPDEAQAHLDREAALRVEAAEKAAEASAEARAAIAAIVMDSYTWFRTLVKERRKLDDTQLARVADGRVFTGRQGLDVKLVDALGNERAALAWLQREKNIPDTTPVRDFSLQPRFRDLSFLHVAAWTFEAAGLSDFARRIEAWGTVRAIERLNLDGLLALWHPSSPN